MKTISASLASTAARPYVGPVDWRRMVQWLSDDEVISQEEAQRTIARCSQAESSQHALVRLANVAMERASDGKPLDIEALSEYLAKRAGLPYLRIDPLKVDVGRVAETIGARLDQWVAQRRWWQVRRRCCRRSRRQVRPCPARSTRSTQLVSPMR